MNDEEDVLKEIREILARKNWVTFDTETTSLEGEIIQWAVHDPISGITGSGLIKATVPISLEAKHFHGITNAMLEGALTFPQAWPIFTSLMKDKEVIIYNAHFDISRLLTSIEAHQGAMSTAVAKQWVRNLQTHCAMEWFAVIYGEWSDFHGSYTYQSLSTACKAYGIPFPKAHRAEYDAQATALLVQKMAAPDDEEEREK